ncbi:hypothetical protein C1646_717784 [Rhizophagus diaphanus]|nr:hypothetical protein C1646_717784 [Rhizophagus diaphanus] [Rhizophagus sp. MUCL 43196]
MPFGAKGIMVSTPFCRPILMITFWDVVFLLWAHYVMNKMSSQEEMSYQNKLIYLAKMQFALVDKINIMELNHLNRPSTVNLMISVEEEKIIRIMFGASVRSGELSSMTSITNLNIATERVKTIPALEE